MDGGFFFKAGNDSLEPELDIKLDQVTQMKWFPGFTHGPKVVLIL